MPDDHDNNPHKYSVVCLTKPAVCVYQPCCHKVTDEQCYNQLVHKTRPVCRDAIGLWIRCPAVESEQGRSLVDLLQRAKSSMLPLLSEPTPVIEGEGEEGKREKSKCLKG